MTDKLFLPCDDGHSIPVLWQKSNRPSAQAIIMIHGFNNDKDENGRYEFLAGAIDADTIRFDYRCHGESRWPVDKFTFSGCVRDVETVLIFFHKRYTCLSVIASSLGGAFALLALDKPRCRIDRLLLLYPVVDFSFILEPNRLAEYESSPYFNESVLSEMRRMKPFAAKLNVPALILHGDKDNRVPLTTVLDRYGTCENPRLIVFKGADHTFTPENMQKVLSYVNSWMIDRLG